MEQQKRQTKISTPVDVSLDIEETPDSTLPSDDVSLDIEETSDSSLSSVNIALDIEEKEDSPFPSDEEGNISFWDYLAKAEGSYKKKRKFVMGDNVLMRPPNLFYNGAKPRRNWYGPFEIQWWCKGKKWVIWDDKLGYAKVHERQLELEYVVEEEIEKNNKKFKKDDV
jgi:hypothetical protein